MKPLPVYTFETNKITSQWSVIDDAVMGGKSSGSFFINENGKGVFEGNVSLENNGGFSSLRYQFATIETSSYTKLKIVLKGDGKRYKFRVKAKQTGKHSYTTYFNTSGVWETIEIALDKLTPAFRGTSLNLPNYDQQSIEELAFLIGNKKEEHFILEIDRIELI
ncbi:CIA30 family protein [Cellulophaga sp. Ld12]|uniref:CIA30 family protein n=1 Tax=Cellulophaga sp. Ld12 TaxID=3229535 RepID=UPI0038699D1C